MYPTVAQARAAVLAEPGRRWLRLRLAPQPAAISVASTRVSDACLDWGRRGLPSARPVVSALVDNGVRHARTNSPDRHLSKGVGRFAQASEAVRRLRYSINDR
jgi:hypothetical protein